MCHSLLVSCCHATVSGTVLVFWGHFSIPGVFLPRHNELIVVVVVGEVRAGGGESSDDVSDAITCLLMYWTVM